MGFVMKNLFEKLLCMHDWKSHAKEEFERFHRLNYIEQVKVKDYTREVLICNKCGKIKIIEY